MKFNHFKEMYVLKQDCKEFLFYTIKEVKEFIYKNSLEIYIVTLSDIGFYTNDNYEIVQDNLIIELV